MGQQIGHRKRFRSKKSGVSVIKSQYSEEILFTAVEELRSGKLKLPRIRYADDVVPGLRFVMNPSGLITFHISYTVGKDRFYLLIGSLNKERDDHITIEKARERAETIKGLAEQGINVEDGLHKRLFEEIDEQGLDWEPTPLVKPKPKMRRRS